MMSNLPLGLGKVLDIVTMVEFIDQANVTMATTKTDVLEPPAKQALERGRKTLENVFSQTRPQDLGALQSTTNEVTFLIEAARLAVESGLVRQDAVEQDFNQARLRG